MNLSEQKKQTREFVEKWKNKENETLDSEISNSMRKYINTKFKDINENKEIELVFYLSQNLEGEKILNVSDKILSSVEQYSSRIFDIKSYFERLNSIFRLFIAEFADFNKTLKPSQISDYKREIELVTANRHFLNFISNGKLLVDFSENQIKRIFSSKSKEAKDIHKITSNLYDSSKNYRLFYNLRNFSQHHGFPITLIKTSSINNIDYKRQYFIEIDYLVYSKFDFQKVFIADLIEYKALGENLNIEELIMPYFNNITQLFYQYNKFYLNLYKDELIKMKNDLVRQGLDEGKYYTTRFTKKEINLSEGNFNLQPVYGKVDIDKIFIDLSEIGLVELKEEK